MSATDIYERRNNAALALVEAQDIDFSFGRGKPSLETQTAMRKLADIEAEFATLMGPHGFQTFVDASEFYLLADEIDLAVETIRKAKALVSTDGAARWVERRVHRIRELHIRNTHGSGPWGDADEIIREEIGRECNWGRYYRPREEPCKKRTTGSIVAFKRSDSPINSSSCVHKLCDEHQDIVAKDLEAKGYEVSGHR